MAEAPVTLELGNQAGGAPARAEAAASGVASGLDALRGALSIPGTAAVEPRTETSPEETDLFPATLRIGEHRLPLGHHAFAWAISTVTGDWAVANSREEVDIQLAALDDVALRGAMHHVTWAIAGRQPAILLRDEELSALATECECTDKSRLLDVARRLLDLRVSLADRDALRDAVAATDDDESRDNPDDAFESLLTRLRPSHLTILMEPELLRRLSLAADDEVGRGLFQLMRDALMTELGIPLPPIKLRASSDLPRGFAAFEYNHLRTEAIRVPWPEQSLVGGDAGPDDEGAVRTRNIAGNRPSHVLASDRVPAWQTQSGFVWSGLQYVILAMAHMTRRNGFVLMDATVARERLEVLRDQFPDLANVMSTVCPVSRFASLLRSLLRSRVSIADLVAIAQAVCDRPDAPEPLVRRRLASMATSRLALETDAVVAYLLAPEIERSLTAEPTHPGLPPAEPGTSGLRRALAHELRGLPATSTFPCVLTEDATRPAVAAALRTSHPDTVVTSYGELPSWINIYPVSRLTMDTDPANTG